MTETTKFADADRTAIDSANRDQLRTWARELGIKGYSALNADALRAVVVARCVEARWEAAEAEAAEAAHRHPVSAPAHHNPPAVPRRVRVVLADIAQNTVTLREIANVIRKALPVTPAGREAMLREQGVEGFVKEQWDIMVTVTEEAVLDHTGLDWPRTPAIAQRAIVRKVTAILTPEIAAARRADKLADRQRRIKPGRAPRWNVGNRALRFPAGQLPCKVTQSNKANAGARRKYRRGLALRDRALLMAAMLPGIAASGE